MKYGNQNLENGSRQAILNAGSHAHNLGVIPVSLCRINLLNKMIQEAVHTFITNLYSSLLTAIKIYNLDGHVQTVFTSDQTNIGFLYCSASRYPRSSPVCEIIYNYL